MSGNVTLGLTLPGVGTFSTSTSGLDACAWVHRSAESESSLAVSATLAAYVADALPALACSCDVPLKEKQRVSATRTSRDTLFDDCGIVTFDAKVRVSDLSTTAQTAIARAIDDAAKLRDNFYHSLQLELRVTHDGGLRDARECSRAAFSVDARKRPIRPGQRLQDRWDASGV